MKKNKSQKNSRRKKVKTYSLILSDGTYAGKFRTKQEAKDALIAQDVNGFVCLYKGSEWGKGKLLSRFVLRNRTLSSVNVDKCYDDVCTRYGVFEDGFCSKCVIKHNIKTDAHGTIESRANIDEELEPMLDGDYIYV